MPQYVLTAAQKSSLDAILGAAVPFSTTGVLTGLTNGTAYTALAIDFSPPFTPAVVEVAPAVTSAATISGTTDETGLLTVSIGAASGTPTPTSAIQWRKDGTNIAATGTTVDKATFGVGVYSAVVTWSNGVAPNATSTSNSITVAAAPVGVATLSGFDFADNELAGTTDQHGTIYYMSSDQPTRTAAQVKAGTGAEDAGSAFVNLGNFTFTLDLTNTATYVDRWLHIVLENDNGFSNVAVVAFQIQDPVPWSITVDGDTVTVASHPTFDATPWLITQPAFVAAGVVEQPTAQTHPLEIV